MAKVHIVGVQTDGPMNVKVLLSNGDELSLLTAVEISTGLDCISTFKIEGYIGGGQTHEATNAKTK